MSQLKRMYRQGDILLVETIMVPGPAKKRDKPVILEGEVTGHAHRMVNGDVYDSFPGVFVIASINASLVHDEHGHINIPPGTYRVVRQREFDDTMKERIVRD